MNARRLYNFIISYPAWSPTRRPLYLLPFTSNCYPIMKTSRATRYPHGRRSDGEYLHNNGNTKCSHSQLEGSLSAHNGITSKTSNSEALHSSTGYRISLVSCFLAVVVVVAVAVVDLVTFQEERPGHFYCVSTTVALIYN